MISQVLKKLRNSNNLTQQEMADQLGISRSTLAGYESENKQPSYETLIQIAKKFDVSTDYLLGVTDAKMQHGLTNFEEKYPLYEEKYKYNMQNFSYYTNLSDGELCKELGVKQEVLEDILSGNTKPSLVVLTKLSEICEVSTDFLLGMREKSRKKNFDGEIPFQFDAEISIRLKNLIGKRNDYYASIVGIEEIEFFNFVEYGFLPHVNVINKLAESFKVSADYLLNLSKSNISIGTDKEARILSAFKQLNEDNQDILIGEALKFIKEQELEEYKKSLPVAADKDKDDKPMGKSYPLNGTEGSI